MPRETNELRSSTRAKAGLDDKDRTLLRLLAQDATTSYADLGERVYLSPPAVHERVKRLKRDGYIKATVALLDGEKIVAEERLLEDLKERIRDVRQGPDGYLYVLTDSKKGRLLRVEPGQ